MKHEHSLDDQIEQLERRLGLRRDRLVRHFEETRQSVKASAANAVGWWPLVAVGGGLAAGFALARRAKHAAPWVSAVRYAPVREVPPAAATTSRNVIASLLAIAATALQIGASNEARTFWNAVRAFRARR